MTSYRLFDGAAGRPGVGSTVTTPPAGPTSYGGNFYAATTFQVTQGAVWLEGFWWWVPPGGDTGAQKFTLWQVWANLGGTVVPGTTVTSGTLTAGAMNYIPLASAVPLMPDIPYLAATAWTASAGFPETRGQFGAGDPFAAGITNGPLQAYSDISTNGGTNPAPSNWETQGSFTTAFNDPTGGMPNLGSDSSSLFWADVQVTDTPPAGRATGFGRRCLPRRT